MLELEIINHVENGYYVNFSNARKYDKYTINGKYPVTYGYNMWCFTPEFPKTITKESRSVKISHYEALSEYVAKPKLTPAEFDSLPDNLEGLYKYVGEEVVEFVPVEFEITKTFGDSVYSIEKVDKVDVSLYHKLGFHPSKWHHLPCRFNRDYGWTVFIETLKSAVDYSKAMVDSYDFSGLVYINNINPYTKELRRALQIQKNELPLFSGTDFPNLMENIRLFVTDILDKVYKRCVLCPSCNGKGFIDMETEDIAFTEFLGMLKLELQSLCDIPSSTKGKERASKRLKDIFSHYNQCYAGSVKKLKDSKVVVE